MSKAIDDWSALQEKIAGEETFELNLEEDPIAEVLTTLATLSNDISIAAIKLTILRNLQVEQAKNVTPVGHFSSDMPQV